MCPVVTIQREFVNDEEVDIGAGNAGAADNGQGHIQAGDFTQVKTAEKAYEHEIGQATPEATGDSEGAH